MKKIFLIVVLLFLTVPTPSYALFGRKDYKKDFLQNAANAEKRHNDKSAFYIYEKTMFYYKNDKQVLEAYAGFCERRKYYDKAEKLYQQLYDLTKDEYYLSKKYSIIVEGSKASAEKLEKISKDKRLSAAQKEQLNTAMILQYSYKKDWAKTKYYCDKLPPKSINGKAVNACVLACENLGDKKAAYNYYLRYLEIYPKDNNILKKTLALAEEFNDYNAQEKYLKRFSVLNPKDSGIKYRLAGFYEKYKHYDKALQVYEKLMADGDKSKHVLDSYKYAKEQLLKPQGQIAQKPEVFIPKLTAEQLKEKQLYDALNRKDFKSAEVYLDELLKKQPKSAKFLRLIVGTSLGQEDYSKALKYLLALNEVKSLSVDDTKLLAFVYSKNDNPQKSLEIIENLLKNSPDNEEFMRLSLQYAMAAKSWDKALVYTNQLLAKNPDSEDLLKNQSDIYSIQKDFPNAIKSLNVLQKLYPNIQYQKKLLDLYIASSDFVSAERIAVQLYQKDSNNPEIVQTYLNILMGQNKIQDAYCLIVKHHLENTKEGYHIFGDMAMANKDYHSAQIYYLKALEIAPKEYSLKNNLAQTYRMIKRPDYAEKLFNEVLCKEPDNLEAQLGLGYVAIDRKKFEKSREIFQSILCRNPKYRPAKIGIVNSYISNGDNFQALNELNRLPQDEEIKLMKAKTYYNMEMPSDAKQFLSANVSKDAEDLKYKIRKDEAITIVPSYSYMQQNLSEQFNLKYNQVGTRVSQKINNNLNVFAEYNMYVYQSGNLKTVQPNQVGVLHNVTNEVRGGVQGRPTEKFEFRADIGTKVFQFEQGFMINTDSWIKHYFSDDFNLKAGFKRNNLEQSYLSAVGLLVGGAFTGQVADNKAYLEYEKKLKNQFYSFGRYGFGSMTAQNLSNNLYQEGMVGVGRVMYNDPDNKWINSFNLDLVSYNTGYQYNLLKIYDDLGNLYGGYFSPSFFTANTVAAKVEGKIKKWNLKYGLKGFGGGQYARNPHLATTTWGISPYIAYDLNDNVRFDLSYSHYNYGDIQRDLFLFNVVIKGFKRRAKS